MSDSAAAAVSSSCSPISGKPCGHVDPRSIAIVAGFAIRDAEDALLLASISESHHEMMAHHLSRFEIYDRIAQTNPHVLVAASPVLQWLRDKTQRYVVDPALKDIVARCEKDETLNGSSLIDKRIVLVCKEQLGFDGAEADTWCDANELSKFSGVGCGNGRVIKVDRQLCSMNGIIPPELSQLKNLTTLVLSVNKLTGPIPSELSRLTNLTGLFLNTNQLTGPIPPELSRLTNLTYLDLSHNHLSGPIPPELSRLTNLTYVNLSDNQFNGKCPESVLKMPNLELGSSLPLDDANK